MRYDRGTACADGTRGISARVEKKKPRKGKGDYAALLGEKGRKMLEEMMENKGKMVAV